MTKDQERMYRFFLGGLTTPEETNALIEADKRSQRSGGTTLTFDGRSFDERWAADPERYAVQMGMRLAALNKLAN